MTEQIKLSDAYNAIPSRQERIRVFVGDKMDENDRETAFMIATDFQDTSRPIARTAVMIPVAAHQDTSHIYETMRGYAEQKGNEPFTIFLYLNAPDGPTVEDLEPAKAEIDRAVHDFHSLDIRSSFTLYDRPTIGQIRGDLWNAVMVLALHEDAFAPGNDDVIGINNDIDTVAISPHYISRIQQHYASKQQNARRLGVPEAALNTAATRVSHAALPSHPNVAKVTKWIDNTYYQAPGHISYEAGLVIPFSFYATRSGFDSEAQTHETSWAYREKIPMVSGAQLFTSPRRYIDLLPEHGTESIWAPGTFGATDRCRDELRDDITQERAEDLILDRLDSDIFRHWLSGAMQGVNDKIRYAPASRVRDQDFLDDLHRKAIPVAENQLGKAERFLRCVIKSDILATILRDSIDGEDYAKTQIQSLTLLRHAFANDLRLDDFSISVR